MRRLPYFPYVSKGLQQPEVLALLELGDAKL